MSRRSIFDSNSTPAPRLLRTNDEPSSQQIDFIRRAIQSTEQWMREDLIDSDEARRRHAAYALFIHNHSALLSPIRRVPVEIWQQIFRLVAHSENFGLLGTSSYRIGQVCRLWNSVAKSVPELLSTLPPVRLTQRTAKPSFTRPLERTISSIPAAYPLIIRIMDPILPDVHPVVQMLYACSQRWINLSILIGRDAMGLVSISLHGNVPNLKKLQLHVPDQSYDYLGQLDAFADAPLLTELDVDCPSPIHLSIPWAQLTRYKERSRGMQLGVARVLKDGEAIEHLEYRTGDPGAIVDVRTSDRATLTKLKSIDIRLYHNSTTGFSLLDQFTAPYLEVIKIKDHGHDFLPFLLDFIEKCSCGSTLTCLIFDTNRIFPGDLTKILLCTPALTKLECNDIPFVDLCMFSVRKGAPTLVPLLHDLVVHSPSPEQLSTLDTLASSRSHMFKILLRPVEGREREGGGSARSQARLDQPFSLKLVFPDHRLCSVARETLIGPEDSFHAIRSTLSDSLAELDIQVDEMKARWIGKVTRKAQLRTFWHSVSDQGPGKKLDEVISYLETVPLDKMPDSIVS
ncbi:hypothetical protein CVT25_003833 [Psilocybe cyanescens]|uniref:F-box domain-containing protein n=1 Tax=Psilocybe cyanescens TaxID=93625 RepID=A0A409XPZ0_PSICY|nr:hypothetical protein CVT25_003833 [Psilocybe cyanescens]